MHTMDVFPESTSSSTTASDLTFGSSHLITHLGSEIPPEAKNSIHQKSIHHIHHKQPYSDKMMTEVPNENSDMGSTDPVTAATTTTMMEPDTSDNITSCMSIQSSTESLTSSCPKGRSSNSISSQLEDNASISNNQSEQSSSSLSSSSSSSSSLSPNRNRTPLSTNSRKVSFGIVEARAFIRTAGDHPAVTTGAALDLSWDYRPVEPKSVDEYETERRHTRRECIADLVVTRFERESLLRNYCDVSRRELAACVRSINRAKAQRRQTLNNLKFARVEECLEKFQKGASKALGLRRSTEKEIGKLWKNAAALASEENSRTVVVGEESSGNLRLESAILRGMDDTGMGSRNINMTDDSNRSIIDLSDQEISPQARRNVEERRRRMIASSSNTSTSFFVRMLRRGPTEGGRRRNSARRSHRIGRRGRFRIGTSRNLDNSRHSRNYLDNSLMSPTSFASSNTHLYTGSNTSSHAGTSVGEILQGASEKEYYQEQAYDFIRNNSRHYKNYDLSMDLDDDGIDDMAEFCQDFSNGCHVDTDIARSDLDSKPKAKEDCDLDSEAKACKENTNVNTATFESVEDDKEQEEGEQVQDLKPSPEARIECAVSSMLEAVEASDDGNDDESSSSSNPLEKVDGCGEKDYIHSYACSLSDSSHQPPTRQSLRNSLDTSVISSPLGNRETSSYHKCRDNAADDDDYESSVLCSSSATAATFASSAANSHSDDNKLTLRYWKDQIAPSTINVVEKETRRKRKYTNIKRKAILATEGPPIYYPDE